MSEPDFPPFVVIDYGHTDVAVDPRHGMGALAFVSSMIVPGLGHALVRDTAGARRWFVLFAALVIVSISCASVPALVPGLLVTLPISVIVQIGSWISAYRSAKRSTRAIFKSAAPRYLLAVGVLVVAVFVAPTQYPLYPWRWYVVEAFHMPTRSMSPTIDAGDRFLVHKLRAFKRFDIVAITPSDPRAPDMLYVKRVVGFPGETIEVVEGAVMIDGKLHHPPIDTIRYVGRIGLVNGKRPNGVEGNPIKLGPDEYFFLGDNSPISGDSRYWDWSVEGHQPGTLPRSHIKGVATWTYWPISRWRRLY